MIVALLDRTDAGHTTCAHAIQQINSPLVSCEAVVSESCFLLKHIPGAAEQVLENLEHGMFQIGFALPNNPTSINGLMRKYRDVPISLADACLIQMADELNTGDILTLDSDFRHYRWRKSKPFNLLIPLS